jgi:hypothetical protein
MIQLIGHDPLTGIVVGMLLMHADLSHMSEMDGAGIRALQSLYYTMLQPGGDFKFHWVLMPRLHWDGVL